MTETAATVESGLDYGPLAGSLGFLLRLSQLKSFDDFFAALGPLDVRPGEMSVLMVLARNPGIRQGVLAEALSIKRAHMAKMVRALEEAGLIRRTVPQDDRRAMELWLTERGQARLAALRPAFAAHEAPPVDGLSPHEAETLKRLLRKSVGMEGGA